VDSARSCPSGAITYVRHDGIADEAPPVVNLVRIRERGPLAFHGALQIGDAVVTRATLCRCGASKNKPYCDGSHTEVGFDASGEPATLESLPLAERAGPVVITPAPNGPLLVAGNLEVVSGTGRTTNRVEKGALCRCGQSANKPYCDGTHRTIGFRTE
jgi:CDGSH-type Zn-finger protein